MYGSEWWCAHYFVFEFDFLGKRFNFHRRFDFLLKGKVKINVEKRSVYSFKNTCARVLFYICFRIIDTCIFAFEFEWQNRKKKQKKKKESIRCETVERGDKQIFTSAIRGDYEYCCRKLKRMTYDGNVKTSALKK